MDLKRITLHPCDKQEAERLAAAAQIPLLLAMVLVSRGVSDVASFLDASPALLGDPFRMLGMKKAAEIIRDAIEKHERIAVYGDYDVDGVTATCVLLSALKGLGADCVYYIPDRLTEGYGLHRGAVERLVNEMGAKLIVTVDTGITATEEVAFCREMGIRIVVTDHHECPDELPAADAVVDPRNPAETYPFCELAGVGVAFKLVQALVGDADAVLEQYAELVSLGTVADVMPLRSENRAIVNCGLKKFGMTSNVGLAALMKEAGIPGNKPVTAATLSFALAPRINAAGRFGMAGRAAELFLTNDPDEAAKIAQELTMYNMQRQTQENEMLGEAMQELEASCDPENDRIFILWHELWHHGILGIVASRLTDRFSRPVILLSVDGEVAKGSGRSIKGFNLYDALAAVPTRPLQFGGHELAAGLTLDSTALEQFREDLRTYASEHLKLEDCVPTLEAECEVEPALLTLEAAESLTLLEPTGMGNPEPLFYMQGLSIREIAAIGNGKHTRMRLERDGVSLKCVYFGKSPEELGLGEGDVIEVCANVQVNDFRGRSVQLVLREARLSATERERDVQSRRVFERFMSGAQLNIQEKAHLRLTRPELIAVWRCLTGGADEKGTLIVQTAGFYREIHRKTNTVMSAGKLLTALCVFDELGLARMGYTQDQIIVQIVPNAPKADLNTSRFLAALAD